MSFLRGRLIRLINNVVIWFLQTIAIPVITNLSPRMVYGLSQKRSTIIYGISLETTHAKNVPKEAMLLMERYLF